MKTESRTETYPITSDDMFAEGHSVGMQLGFNNVHNYTEVIFYNYKERLWGQALVPVGQSLDQVDSGNLRLWDYKMAVTFINKFGLIAPHLSDFDEEAIGRLKYEAKDQLWSEMESRMKDLLAQRDQILKAKFKLEEIK